MTAKQRKKENLLFLIKRLWKPFLVFFVISYFVLNWENASWLFNYKVVFQLARQIVSEKKIAVGNKEPENQNQVRINGEENDGSLIDETDGEEPFEQETTAAEDSKINTISISKLGVSAPLVIANTTDNNTLHAYLDKGVVMYPGSANPGDNGQTIFLGHSAPAGWPKIKFDWVFTRLNELENGDSVTVIFGGKTYNYSVTSKIFLEKGEELPKDTGEGSHLFLISCWPPGKDYRRIAVEAVIIQ